MRRPAGEAARRPAGEAARRLAGDGGRVVGIGADDMVAATVRLQAKLANVLWRTARFDEARTALQSALALAGAGTPRSTRCCGRTCTSGSAAWR